MTLTNHPNGVSSFGIPVLGAGGSEYAGSIPVGTGYWFVDSVNGSDGYDGTWDAPYASLAKAHAMASAGQVIVLKPGHAESVASAGAIALSTAGIRIVGLGEGRNRPTFTFTTTKQASITISGDNIALTNVIGIAGVTVLSKPFDITGDNVRIEIEWYDGTGVLAANTVVKAVGLVNLKIKASHFGNTSSAVGTRFAYFANVKNADVYVDYYGKASTGVINLANTCLDVAVSGSIYNSGTTDGSKNVVDTAGTSTWTADLMDRSAAARYTAGSRATVRNWEAPSPANYFPGLGYKVSKNENVVTATGVDLFTVTGKVLVTMWTGEVTTAIGGTGTTDYKIRIKSSVGSDLCATADIHGAAANTMFVLSGRANTSVAQTTGTVPRTLIKGSAEMGGFGMANRIVGMANSTVTIQSLRTAATTTGAILHNIYYIPLEAGSVIVAA